MTKKPRILLTYVESGKGHKTSMQSIADSLKNKYGSELELIEDNIMEHSPITQKYERFLTKQVQNTNSMKGFGPFMFWFIEVMGAQKFLNFLCKTLFRKPFDETLLAIDRHKPDVIVSTHYFLTYCAIEYKILFNPSVEIVTYNPDNNVHTWWDGRDGWFFVNNEFAQNEAVRKRGFKAENIRLVNYTKRQVIMDATGSKADYRKRYGLPQDKFTVIIADGAYALGESRKYAKKLLKTKKPLTILFIAGENDKVYLKMVKERYKLGKKGKTNITLRVYHFMPMIHELYKASDLFITKAGPNSILDSVLMGTPVCVNFCPQPMEKAAYIHFIKKLGCGFAQFKASKIRPTVEKLIDDPSLLDKYRDNIAGIAASENGADTIADFIYERALAKKENERCAEHSASGTK